MTSKYVLVSSMSYYLDHRFCKRLTYYNLHLRYDDDDPMLQ